MSREEYNRRYAAYQKELHKFRLKTTEDLAKKKAEKERLAAVESSDLVAEKTAEDEEREQRNRIRAERRQQMRKQLKDSRQRQKETFKRETTRRELLRKAEDDRYAKLLQQSRSWITAETLDDRIASALDNTTTLY